MLESRQINVSTNKISPVAVIALAMIFVFGVFLVGFDQGHLANLLPNAEASDGLYIHELTHDLRHAAGFPCH